MIPSPATLVPLRTVALPMAAALLAEPLAWGLVAWPGTLGPSWVGRPGLLVAVHLLTLGTLGLSILGAGWQLLPVVTTRPLSAASQRLALGLNVTAVLGTALLLSGLLGARGPLALGASLVIAALLGRSLVVVPALLRTRGRAALRLWLLGAEGCLWAGLALGAGLVGDRLGLGWLPDHYASLGTHASLLLGGWVTGWILGLGGLLLPMFGVAPEPRPLPWGLSAGVLFLGLALRLPWLWSVGATSAAALLGFSLHRRVKRRLGPGLAIAASALGGLAVVAALVATTPGAPGQAGIAGGLVIFALPALRGVGLRILPFLAWAHAFGAQGKGAPPVAALVPERAAWLGGLGSLLAGAALLFALAAGQARAAQLCALALGLGALTHLGVVLEVARRTLRAALRRGAVPGMEAR